MKSFVLDSINPPILCLSEHYLEEQDPLNLTLTERIVLLDFIHHLVSQKIEELKYIYQISQYTCPQNSHKGQLLTTEPLTSVHTHINP
jgi:hypothetical protein